MAVIPQGDSAAEPGALEFADADVVDVGGLGQVADEGPEELLAGAAGGPLDHRPEGVQVVGYHGVGRPLTPAGRRLAVPTRLLGLEEALEIGRVRWQIKMLFKLW
jgi:hypothetical protein